MQCGLLDVVVLEILPRPSNPNVGNPRHPWSIEPYQNDYIYCGFDFLYSIISLFCWFPVLNNTNLTTSKTEEFINKKSPQLGSDVFCQLKVQE